MLENEIEQKMKEMVEAVDGKLLKMRVTGESGIPDRLMLLPGGKACFVELKQKGKKPTKKQLYYHQKLIRQGHAVYVIDNVQDAADLVQEKLTGQCGENHGH